LAVRALEDLYVLIPVNGWKLQQLVRGEGIGEAALGWEPVEFLGIGNSNVFEQQSWDVAIGKVMDGHTNAISDGSVVAFSSLDMLVFKESLELDVRINRGDIDGGSIVSVEDVVE